MVSFVALYRGASLSSTELIAVSTNPDVISFIAGALLKERTNPSDDPAVSALGSGRRRALRIVHKEAKRGIDRKDMTNK